MASLSEGTRIGQYRVVRKLGEGGMGEVFEAVHEALGRRAAIKVLHVEYTKNAEIVRRFFNEARAVNMIEHPGMVQIYDFGQLPDGTTYIVMEYLKGESLASRRKRLGGVLPAPDVVRLGHLIADGLAAVHVQGIVHRDLKPDNVMIVADPNVPGGERTKLLDFGIAKLCENSGVDKTRTSAVMGTPHFMSPEQCRGAGEVDDRTDVYALGIMLYLLLAGRPPFDGEGVGEIMGKHMYEQPPPLRSIAPQVPPLLVALVDGLLQKDRQQRPAMRQVAADLALMQQGPAMAAVGTGTMPLDPQAVPAAMPVPLDRPSTLGLARGQVTAQRGPGRRVGLAIGSTVVLLIGAFAGVRSFRRPEPPGSMTATETATHGQAVTVPRLVSWQVNSEPSGAEVIRASDGVVLGRTPWRHQQPMAAGTLRVLLRLAGHMELEVSLAKDADATRKETLEPLEAPASPASLRDQVVLPAQQAESKPKHRRLHPELRIRKNADIPLD